MRRIFSCVVALEVTAIVLTVTFFGRACMSCAERAYSFANPFGLEPGGACDLICVAGPHPSFYVLTYALIGTLALWAMLLIYRQKEKRLNAADLLSAFLVSIGLILALHTSFLFFARSHCVPCEKIEMEFSFRHPLGKEGEKYIPSFNFDPPLSEAAMEPIICSLACKQNEPHYLFYRFAYITLLPIGGHLLLRVKKNFLRKK